jgi:hypothetical protein
MSHTKKRTVPHIPYDQSAEETDDFDEREVRKRITHLTRYQVTYELRETHVVTVDARTPQEAEEMVNYSAYPRHRQSIYDIEEVTPLEILDPEKLPV